MIIWLYQQAHDTFQCNCSVFAWLTMKTFFKKHKEKQNKTKKNLCILIFCGIRDLSTTLLSPLHTAHTAHPLLAAYIRFQNCKNRLKRIWNHMRSMRYLTSTSTLGLLHCLQRKYKSSYKDNKRVWMLMRSTLKTIFCTHWTVLKKEQIIWVFSNHPSHFLTLFIFFSVQLHFAWSRCHSVMQNGTD